MIDRQDDMTAGLADRPLHLRLGQAASDELSSESRAEAEQMNAS